LLDNLLFGVDSLCNHQNTIDQDGKSKRTFIQNGCIQINGVRKVLAPIRFRTKRVSQGTKKLETSTKIFHIKPYAKVSHPKTKTMAARLQSRRHLTPTTVAG
jgi:hypothetical protein